MKICNAVACVALSAIAAPSPASAQAAPAPAMPLKAEKNTDLKYFVFEKLTSKPGAKTWTIISKHFIPAAKAAGTPMPTTYHTETGESVTMVITPLPGGLADLEWAMSPDDVKFMTALAKQEGGPDKAQALWKEFNEGIEHRTREIIHEHVK